MWQGSRRRAIIPAPVAKVRLDTNVSSVAAVRLLEAHGLTAIGRYNDHPHAELFCELDLRRGS
jgi:hypothetical protein